MNATQILGKASELLVSSKLLAENRELYQPLVDDHGVDLIVRTKDWDSNLDDKDPRHYEFQEIQVKSIQKGGLFAAITIEPRANYWFVFYIKDIDRMWLVNSKDIDNHETLNAGLVCGDAGYLSASQNKQGKYIGKWSLDFSPTKRCPIKSADYLAENFNKLP